MEIIVKTSKKKNDPLPNPSWYWWRKIFLNLMMHNSGDEWNKSVSGDQWELDFFKKCSELDKKWRIKKCERLKLDEKLKNLS